MKRMLVICMFCLVFCGLSFGQDSSENDILINRPTEGVILGNEKYSEPIKTENNDSESKPEIDLSTPEPVKSLDDKLPVEPSDPRSVNNEEGVVFTNINYIKGDAKYSYGTVLHCYQTTNSLSTFVQCLDSFEYFFDNNPDVLLNKIQPDYNESIKDEKTNLVLVNGIVENYGIPN